MKIIVFVFLFSILCFNSLFSQQDYSFSVYDEMPKMQCLFYRPRIPFSNEKITFAGYEYGNRGGGAFSYTISNKQLAKISSIEIKSIEDDFIIVVEDKIVSKIENSTNTKIAIPLTVNDLQNIIWYQNDEAFLMKSIAEGQYLTRMYNFKTNTFTNGPYSGEEFWGEVYDISNGKQIALMIDHYSFPTYIRIWDMQLNDTNNKIRYISDRTLEAPVMLLTNNLFLLAPRSITEEKYWEIYSINGALIEKVRFFDTKGKPYHYIHFTPDLRHAIAYTGAVNANDNVTYILDTSSFRKYFEDNGLLFEKTTAILNDTHVRVRQYANLEAKHLGFLDKGDKVKVLERSALKRIIDPWGEHYWYKINRESDGLSGWTFGAFLEF